MLFQNVTRDNLLDTLAGSSLGAFGRRHSTGGKPDMRSGLKADFRMFEFPEP